MEFYHFFYECCWSTSGNGKCKFYFNFFSNNRNNQIITEHSKEKKKEKKHDKILMLAKRKLDSIETLVSQALIDMEISVITREKKNMRGWKKI